VVPLLAVVLLSVPMIFSIALAAGFSVIILHKIVQVPASAPIAVPWGEAWAACSAWVMSAWDYITRHRHHDDVTLPPGVGNRIPDI
jgi:hypothetical protein